MRIHIVVLRQRDQIGIWKCWFLRRGKTRVPGEKPLRARERTNKKLNSHMASIMGFEPGPHWWEASALTNSHHFAALPPCSCSLTWEFWSLKVSFLLQMMEIGFILLNGKEQQRSLHGKGWGFFYIKPVTQSGPHAVVQTLAGADPGFFLGGGTLVSYSTSTPINHIVFFWRNTSWIRKPPVISGGGGVAHPLHPPPRSAPDLIVLSTRYITWLYISILGNEVSCPLDRDLSSGQCYPPFEQQGPG